MKITFLLLCLMIVCLVSCNKNAPKDEITILEKNEIEHILETNYAKGILATRTKDIELYMKQLPEDIKIYDESGVIVTKEMQRSNALRDWSIIDTTLDISIVIDSVKFERRDSIYVFTYQNWKRLMFQRDGITKDTVTTTQRHKELWKKNEKGWFGYEVMELGGEIYINGELYTPE